VRVWSPPPIRAPFQPSLAASMFQRRPMIGIGVHRPRRAVRGDGETKLSEFVTV
jgi:hypothetical protein